MTKSVAGVTRLAAVAGLTLLVAGCESQKSRNPLSPNVAGPIPGVTIATPVPVSPANGEWVANSEPLRLVFSNASSTGERPFWYVVELASDSEFRSKLYTKGHITPAPGAQTSTIVDGTLVVERSYYWRVKAEDGANASDFSTPAAFELIVPIVIGTPVPVSPVGGQTIASVRPTLTVNNGAVSGRTGSVEYWFEIARDQAFTDVVHLQGVARGPGATTAVLGPDLTPDTMYFWRAIASNGAMHSPWSPPQSFRTGTAPGSAGGGGGGGYAPPPAPAPGGRTPDPPPGGQLPLPNMFGVVQQLAAQYPHAVANSCQDHGGTWEFMDRVVDELRKYDSRWGYNWKRGVVGDPSKDVVDYHWGAGPSEGSTEVYIIDIIVGHCGPNPSAGWGDVTEITYASGTVGRWTGRGRF